MCRFTEAKLRSSKIFTTVFCVVNIPPECKKYTNSKIINAIVTYEDLARNFQSVQYVVDLKEIDTFLRGSHLVCFRHERYQRINGV